MCSWFDVNRGRKEVPPETAQKNCFLKRNVTRNLGGKKKTAFEQATQKRKIKEKKKEEK